MGLRSREGRRNAHASCSLIETGTSSLCLQQVAGTWQRVKSHGWMRIKQLLSEIRKWSRQISFRNKTTIYFLKNYRTHLLPCFQLWTSAIHYYSVSYRSRIIVSFWLPDSNYSFPLISFFSNLKWNALTNIQALKGLEQLTVLWVTNWCFLQLYSILCRYLLFSFVFNHFFFSMKWLFKLGFR